MSLRINEHDEFLLSRWLDGDLSAAEAEALERRLEREPGLRSASEQMRRLDTLLSARRGDQPEIDWGRFRAGVMDRVRAERTEQRIIRFPRWLPVAGALAAAAAIALVFTLRPDGNAGVSHPPSIASHDGGVGDGGQAAPIVVQVHRPVYASAGASGPLKVSFVRDNNELAADYLRLDKDREDRTSYVAATPRGPNQIVLPGRDAPL